MPKLVLSVLAAFDRLLISCGMQDATESTASKAPYHDYGFEVKPSLEGERAKLAHRRCRVRAFAGCCHYTQAKAVSGCVLSVGVLVPGVGLQHRYTSSGHMPLLLQPTYDICTGTCVLQWSSVMFYTTTPRSGSHTGACRSW